jgi:peroxiredoxin (alkyl hydroperoxide reductase subunit C)
MHTIAVGQSIPSMALTVASPKGPRETTTEALFKGRKIVLFGVPGAFTPTCSTKHLPGFLDKLEAIQAKGVDAVICMSVNDAFVMRAWEKDQGVDGRIVLLADGSALFTRALGLECDLSARGLGTRCQRFALIAEDGVVTHLAIEQPGSFEVSRAETILGVL